MDKIESKNISEIWNISDDVVNKNKEIKEEILSEEPNDIKVAKNVNGYIINEAGRLVAKFGFFATNTNDETIDLQISKDGFLAKLYNEPMRIILGYNHPLGIAGMVDPKKSNIMTLSPAITKGDDLVFSIANDDDFKKFGIVCIIRDKDVMVDLLPEDVKENFKQSLIDSSKQISDMNELEESYVNYLKHIYVILSENDENNIKIDKEEVYE